MRTNIKESNYFTLPGLKGNKIFKPFSTHEHRAILESVAEHYDLDVEELFNKRRHQGVVLARHMSMFLMKKYTRMTLTAIAKIYKRDHTTIIHACRQIDNLLETDPTVRQDMHSIEMRFL